MSATSPILANSTPFMISNDGGVTFKNVVCKKTFSFSGTAEVAKETTDCGVFKAPGAIDQNFPFEFLLNKTPNGASEWGSDAIMGFFQSGTLLTVKVTDSDGYFRSASGYITAYSETAPQGGMISGSGTFDVSGTLDYTA